METREAACKAALVTRCQVGGWAKNGPHFSIPRPRAQRAWVSCIKVPRSAKGSQKWAELEPKFSYLPRTGLATGAGSVLAQSSTAGLEAGEGAASSLQCTGS